MYTVLYSKIDYYITMENKEVISFKISNSTKSYVAAVSVCMWGRGECVKVLTSPLQFSDILAKTCRKGRKEKKKIPTHVRQKPMAKLHMDFFKVKNIPMM